MYVAILFIGITNATAVQPVVSVERFVSYRERAAGMYSALPYALAQVYDSLYHIIMWFFTSTLEQKTVKSLTISWLVCFGLQVAIEFPYVFAQSIIYSTVFYSMASFDWTLSKFTWYIFFMYFTMLYFTFYGMMTTAVTPNHNVAAIIAAPFYMLWNLFSGFMIPHKVRTCLFSFSSI